MVDYTSEYREHNRPLLASSIFLRSGRAEPGAGFRGHGGGETTLATEAPSDLTNCDRTAESCSSIRICVLPNPASSGFRLRQIGGEETVLPPPGINRECDACLRVPGSRSRYSSNSRARAFNVFTLGSTTQENINSTDTFGIVMSARGPRIMQLGVQLLF